MTKKTTGRFFTLKISLIVIFTILGYISAFALGNYTMANITIVILACGIAGTVGAIFLASSAARLTGFQISL